MQLHYPDYAIPHQFEDAVYQRSLLGYSYRNISQWLADEHRIDASYMAVSSCIKRVAKQREEADEALFAPGPLTANGLARLNEVDHIVSLTARKAWRKEDLSSTLRAQATLARIAFKRLEHERCLLKLNARASTQIDLPSDATWESGQPKALLEAAESRPPAPPAPEYPVYGSDEFEDLEEADQLKADEVPDRFPRDSLAESDPRAWHIAHGASPEKYDKAVEDVLGYVPHFEDPKWNPPSRKTTEETNDDIDDTSSPGVRGADNPLTRPDKGLMRGLTNDTSAANSSQKPDENSGRNFSPRGGGG